MNAFLEKIKSIALERFNSPFISAYLVALVGFNWRVIAVLLVSSQPIEARISYIEQVHINAFSYFWMPFLIACLYAFGNPWISVLIVRVATEAERLKNGHHFKLESDMLVKENALNRLRADSQKIGGEVDIEEAKREMRRTVIDKVKSSVASTTVDGARLISLLTDAYKNLDALDAPKSPESQCAAEASQS